MRSALKTGTRDDPTSRLAMALFGVLVWSCSSDGPSAQNAPIDGGLGTGGSARGGAANAGAGGSTNAAGASGSGGQAGAQSHIDAGNPSPPSTCSAFTLAGVVGGSAFQRTYTGGTIADMIGQVWELRRPFGTEGLVHVVGTEYGDPRRFSAGTPHAVRGGYVLMPTEGPNPGSFFCATQTSTVQGNPGALQVTIEGSKVLGSCPGGAPVPGTVDLCIEFNQAACQLAISGSIDSIPLEAAEASSAPVGGSNTYAVAGFGVVSTVVAARLDGAPAFTPSGGVIGGFIATGPDGPHGGAIYCIGGGTYDYSASGATPTRLTITTLSKLGSCGPADGTDRLSVCIPAP